MTAEESKSRQLLELFATLEEAQQLVQRAYDRTSRGFEEEFVRTLRSRIDTHRMKTFVSDAQLAWIHRIAARKKLNAAAVARLAASPAPPTTPET